MQAELKKRRNRKKRWRRLKDRDFHRGTYIFPNLFTTANLFSGFFGIVSAINGRFEVAAFAILASCIFDILDGKVARLTRATSRFGVEYDSLADLVAFGVAPALLMYLWALKPFGRLGWLACFIFVACGALRLARFNVQVDVVSKKYFVGLPIPGGASMIATTVLFIEGWRTAPSSVAQVVLLVATFLLGFLMVSTIPFYSFKDLEFVKSKPVPVLVGLAILVAVIALSPERMLFFLLLAYVVAGPVCWVLFKAKGKGDVFHPPAPAEPAEPVAAVKAEEKPAESGEETPPGQA